MIKKYYVNDLKQNKMTVLSIMVFIMMSTLLLTSALLLFTHLSRAVDQLMTSAEAPHFMQMHKGEIDKEILTQFCEENPEIKDYQITSFVNIPNEIILVNGNSFIKSVQDIGLVKQSADFDYLLNDKMGIIKPTDGEIYVPYYYIKNRQIMIGDQIKIFDQEFVVKGYHHDAIMNSSLASSKRFLVNEKALNLIKTFGTMEYLIEFRLNDIEGIKEFETKFAQLPDLHNGPTLTYGLFYFLNSISNGLMIVVLVVLSLAVILISFLCIRFTLLSKFEEDYREIGVMKILGIPNRIIEKLYITKYLFITGLGISLGYILTIVFKQRILKNILADFGTTHTESIDWLLCLIVPISIGLIIIGVVYLTIKKLHKLDTIGALNHPSSNGYSDLSKRLKLHNFNSLSVLDFVSLKELLVNKKIYGALILLMSISFLMMNLPTNLYSTISSEKFVTYMGVGKSDFRVDLLDSIASENIIDEVVKSFDADTNISQYVVLETKSYQMTSESNERNIINVELGDHSVFPIHYSIGHMPQKVNEVAFSIISKESFDLELGDTVQIEINGIKEGLIVCGFYSDITNGGKTAKATFADHQSDMIWSVIYADISDVANKAEVIKTYQQEFLNCRVTDIKFFVRDTFGQMLKSVKRVASIGVFSALLLIYLITVLLVRLILLRDKSELVALKTIGFSSRSLQFQAMRKIGLCTLLALVCSYGFYVLLGQRLIAIILANFGVSAFKMNSNFVLSGVLYPIIFLLVIEGAVLVTVQVIKSWTVLDGIRE